MDHVDKNILLALQDHARISMTELGRMVGLTQPAVTERVRRMEEKGIIRNYRTVVAREKIGKHAMAVIWVRVTHCEPFYAFCHSAPEIIECHRLSGGEYNHLLKVVTESLPDLEVFENQILKYGSFATSVVLSSPVDHKSLTPVIPEPN